MTADVGSILLASYVAVSALLFAYGVNCYYFTLLRWRSPPPRTRASWWQRHPVVTVQLPIYNEQYVLPRLLDAVTRMRWPRDRLEVQVLDDSTDETREAAAELVKHWRAQGFDIHHVVRRDRTGFKAGALGAGLARCRGEFVAVFDADFLPEPGFLERTLPHFDDARVACVQTRWTHVNRDYSWLTRTQAIGIDGHFAVEQRVRSENGFLMNFNGTAGVWRRSAILDAGNWSADTLAEDLDLSYRAQLRGWRLVYLDAVESPAELPAQVQALKRQQARWARGSIQCARKHLRTLLASPVPRIVKLEGALHLTHYAIHPLMLALMVLLLPLMLATTVPWPLTGFFLAATFGPSMMYTTSQRLLHPRAWRRRLLNVLSLTFLGIGLSVSNTRSVAEGLVRRGGAFKRTPKFRIEQRADTWRNKKYALGKDWTLYAEGFFAAYAAVTLGAALATGHYFLVPWILLFLVGYAGIFALSVLHRNRPPIPAGVTPSASPG